MVLEEKRKAKNQKSGEVTVRLIKPLGGKRTQRETKRILFTEEGREMRETGGELRRLLPIGPEELTWTTHFAEGKHRKFCSRLIRGQGMSMRKRRTS